MSSAKKQMCVLEKTRHRLRLLHVSRQLTKENIAELVYLLQDSLPDKAIVKSTSAIALLHLLEQKGHIKPQSYGHLKTWLEYIGRSDLAQLLPESESGLRYHETVAPEETEDYRFALMDVSRSLKSQEVKQLVYVCEDYINQSSAEDITEAYQLFRQLERMGKLGPGNYGYIAKCLQHIGRVDLINKLTSTVRGGAIDDVIPNLPQSLRGSQQAYITVYSQSKQSAYATSMRSLCSATSTQAWAELAMTLMDEYHLAWKQDLPIPLWKPEQDPNYLPLTADKISHESLAAAFSFAEAEIEAQSFDATVGGETYKKLYMNCLKRYEELDKIFDAIQWNPATRARVNRICSERLSPQGMAVRKVKKCITDFCTDVLQDERIKEELQKQDSILCAFEATYYEALLSILTTQWLSNVLYLVSTSSVDLSSHLELFKHLLLKHREGINLASPTLIEIVGQDILNLVAPILSENKTEKGDIHLSLTAKCSLHFALNWYILLLELFGCAMGCNIDHQRIADNYLGHAEKNKDIILQGVLVHAQMMTEQLYVQVHDLKCAAAHFANNSTYECGNAVFELFHSNIPSDLLT